MSGGMTTFYIRMIYTIYIYMQHDDVSDEDVISRCNQYDKEIQNHASAMI